VAPAQVVGIEFLGRTGDLVDLIDPGLHQVDRQWRVAQRVGLLLALAQEVVGELGERAAFFGGEVRGGVLRDDHVAVAGQRIGPRVEVDVDLAEVRGEVRCAPE